MRESEAVQHLAQEVSSADLWLLLGLAMRNRRAPRLRRHWRAMVRQYQAALDLKATDTDTRKDGA